MPVRPDGRAFPDTEGVTLETATTVAQDASAGRAPSRRELFALAAVLAATALTAGAAIAGLTTSPRRAARVNSRPSTRSSRLPGGPVPPSAWSRATDAHRLGDRALGLGALRRRRRAGLDAPAAAGAPAQGPSAPWSSGARTASGSSCCCRVRHARSRPMPRRGPRRCPQDDRSCRSAGVPVAWLVARAAGLVAFGLLTLSVWLGLAMSTKLLSPSRAKTLLGWHQTLIWDGARHGRAARRGSAPRPDAALRAASRPRPGHVAVAADRGLGRRRHRLADAHARDLVPRSAPDRREDAGDSSTTRPSPGSRWGSGTPSRPAPTCAEGPGLLVAALAAGPVLWLTFVRILMPRATPPDGSRRRRPSRPGSARDGAARWPYDQPTPGERVVSGDGHDLRHGGDGSPVRGGGRAGRADGRPHRGRRPASGRSRASSRRASSPASTPQQVRGLASASACGPRCDLRSGPASRDRRAFRPDDPARARRGGLRPLVRATRRPPAAPIGAGCGRGPRVRPEREGGRESRTASAVDLGGIGKGFAAGRAVDAMRAAWPRMSGALVDLGGDIAVWGMPPEGGAWLLAVADPLAPETSVCTLGARCGRRGNIGARLPAVRARAVAPSPDRPRDRRARARRAAGRYRRRPGCGLGGSSRHGTRRHRSGRGR